MSAPVEEKMHHDVEEIIPGLVADRRYLHQHPELGFEEVLTSGFAADRLRSLGFDEVRTGLAKTGVIGFLKGRKGGDGPGKTLVIRADMDALPVEEENDVEYKSTVAGKMHACGHDAHVAMLLGSARLLSERRDEFHGTIMTLFQPAEEGGGGAWHLIDQGALDNPRPDASLGLHIWQGADVGTVEVSDGICMVGADGFTITIQGKGGHGAQPHVTVDPIIVAAHIVTALENAISRESDPTLPKVITVGSIHAGFASNVIPDTAEIKGSIRTVNPEQRDFLVARVTEIATGVAKAYRAEAKVDCGSGGCPPTVNDPAMAAIVREAATAVVGAANVVPGPLKAASEDMSFILNHAPGCYFFVGSRNAERDLVWGHHHPRFDVDEAALGIGVETTVRAALAYMNR